MDECGTWQEFAVDQRFDDALEVRVAVVVPNLRNVELFVDDVGLSVLAP